MYVAGSSSAGFQVLPSGEFWFDTVCELGSGGLGRVDKIRVTATNAPGKPVGSEWARKRLNAKWDQHPVARERFDREILTLKRLAHAAIIAYEGENVARGRERFYVMPLYAFNVRGLIRGTPTPWQTIARHGAYLADALLYAHEMGVRHRDIKPENILFNGGGPLVLADWGIGYFVHQDSKVLESLTRAGGMGTEYYCSIEQWHNLPCDERIDIYALGMTLDEWAVGRQRTIVQGHGISTGGPSTPATTRGAMEFNAVLREMTARGKEDRIRSMQDVSRRLRQALALG